MNIVNIMNIAEQMVRPVTVYIPLRHNPGLAVGQFNRNSFPIVNPLLLLKSEGAMAEKIDSKVTYFLLGLGVGSLIGILFASRTGEETREYASQNAQKRVRDLQERAEDVVQRGKEVLTQKKEEIAAAVNVGREIYQREKSKAKGA